MLFVFRVLIIAGNILCLNFAFVQDNTRFIALFGYRVYSFADNEVETTAYIL